MKNFLLTLILFALSVSISAQQASYYNNTVGLDGTSLKTALNGIIDSHNSFEYGTVKQILRLSDEDPNNPDNIILFYTGWSIPKANFASNMDSLNFWNREHVWAKSHGDFGTDIGPGTDAHAIRPVDATVNSARSYKDFDNGGSEYYDAGIATGCFSDGDSWEPRDEVKGDVARMIFYMATRYEGANGEIDLEVVDAVNTFPAPQHGKLSSLLQWNLLDPPDEFEKDRNDMVFNWQQNRNPFIDYPEFAEYIWNNISVSPVQINNVTLDPALPIFNDPVEIASQVVHSSGGTINSVVMDWGLSWGNLSNNITMTGSGNNYIAQILGQPALTRVYYRITATSGTEEKVFFGSYRVGNEPFAGTLTSIYDIQGQNAVSPMQGQIISTSGIVTGAFGSNFFLQDGTGPWNGVYVYGAGDFPFVGDSVIITAEIDEYYELTELKNVTEYYYISSYNMLPEPVVISTGSMQDEQYEGCLVRLEDATCVRDTTFGMWFVNDGSGDAIIHNSSIFSFPYVIGDVYTITGPLNFDFGEFKIELRGEEDVIAGIDSEAPVLLDLEVVNSTIINLLFSEDIDNSTGSDPLNYSINNGITINNSALHSFDKTKVILTVSELINGSYTLTADGVEDLSGNAISNIQIDFTYPSNSIKSNISNDLNIWPNPAKDVVNIEMLNNFDEDVQVELYDISGRVVQTDIIENLSGKVTLSLLNINAGVYMVSVKINKTIYVSKIIKN